MTKFDGFESRRPEHVLIAASELPKFLRRAVRLLGRTLRAGDKRACEALVDAHHCALVALARTYVRSHEVADEIAQETWVAVLARIDRFPGRSSRAALEVHLDG